MVRDVIREVTGGALEPRIEVVDQRTGRFGSPVVRRALRYKGGVGGHKCQHVKNYILSLEPSSRVKLGLRHNAYVCDSVILLPFGSV
jgi:hypothetical protein